MTEDAAQSKPDKMTLIVHSGDMDKIYSALILGNGALAMGMEASMFITFWGLERIQKGGLDKGPLSKMNFLGLGKWMIKRRMKRSNVASLQRLMEHSDLTVLRRYLKQTEADLREAHRRAGPVDNLL